MIRSTGRILPVLLHIRAAGTGALSRHKTSVRTGFIPRSPLGTKGIRCAVCGRTAAYAMPGPKAFLPCRGEGDNSGAEAYKPPPDKI